MLGACAAEAGIHPTSGLLPGAKGAFGKGVSAGIFHGRSETRFNQFACTEPDFGMGCQVRPHTPWPAPASRPRPELFAALPQPPRTHSALALAPPPLAATRQDVEWAEYPWPCTMHPLRRAAMMRNLHSYFEQQATRPTPLVALRRVDNATLQPSSETRSDFEAGARLVFSAAEERARQVEREQLSMRERERGQRSSEGAQQADRFEARGDANNNIVVIVRDEAEAASGLAE